MWVSNPTVVLRRMSKWSEALGVAELIVGMLKAAQTGGLVSKFKAREHIQMDVNISQDAGRYGRL